MNQMRYGMGRSDIRSGIEREMRTHSGTSRPRGVTVERHDDYLHITERLEGWSGLFVRLFMAGIAALAWVWFFRYALRALAAEAGWVWLFPLFYLGMALTVSYVALAYFKNRHHLYLSPDTLEVYQAPMWMPGHKRLDASKIEQVYVRHHNPANGGSRTEVRAKMHSGADIRLLRITYPIENAHYIEREIETYLGIEDRSVVGEYQPGD